MIRYVGDLVAGAVYRVQGRTGSHQLLEITERVVAVGVVGTQPEMLAQCQPAAHFEAFLQRFTGILEFTLVGRL